jgi:tetratricopeptide (TPR) repeat protein
MKNSFGLNRYYIAVIVLCALAGFSARFLVMSPETTALMYMEAGLFDEAIKRYEKLLADGDKSGNVIIPLARLYRARGDEKLAQGLLIKYICENPISRTPGPSSTDAQEADEPRGFPEDSRSGGQLPGHERDPARSLRLVRSGSPGRASDGIPHGARQTPRTEKLRRGYAKILGYFALNIKLAPVPRTGSSNSRSAGSPDEKTGFPQILLRSGELRRFQAAARQAAAHFENAKKLDAQEFESVVDIS